MGFFTLTMQRHDLFYVPFPLATLAFACRETSATVRQLRTRAARHTGA